MTGVIEIKKFRVYVLFSILISVIISGCSTPSKSNADNENPYISQVIDLGYVFDETTNRYINNDTGIWCVIENGYVILPAEQYVSPGNRIEAINIKDRPNDVWQIESFRYVTVKEGDNFNRIVGDSFFTKENYFRMDYNWLEKQVKELHNIEDTNLIKIGDAIKIPIYIDSASKT